MRDGATRVHISRICKQKQMTEVWEKEAYLRINCDHSKACEYLSTALGQSMHHQLKDPFKWTRVAPHGGRAGGLLHPGPPTAQGAVTVAATRAVRAAAGRRPKARRLQVGLLTPWAS